MADDTLSMIGWIAYLVGFIGSIAAGIVDFYGLVALPDWTPIIFLFAGVLVGLINITNAEFVVFMLSVLVIGVGTGVLAMLPMIGGVLEAIFYNIAALSIAGGVSAGLLKLFKVAQ